MAKRPSPLETLQLSIELLRHIPKRGTITSTQLRDQLAAAGFERKPRTIQRLLETLCTSDLHDIECDASVKPYRYRWKEGAKGLSLGGLSAQETLLLTLAQQQLRNLLPAKLMKSMDGFFSQARGELDEKSPAQRDREWLGKVRVVSTNQPLLPPKINPDVFEQVSDALYGNNWLDVEYKNAQGLKSTSRLMPLGLAQQGPRMYLVCRYEGFNNERSLALHRIVSAVASTLTFERPREFSLLKYDDDGRFGFGVGKKIRLSFEIEKDAGLHIVECPLALDQKVLEKAHTYEITATVVDTDMLEWWLRGFGDRIINIVKMAK